MTNCCPNISTRTQRPTLRLRSSKTLCNPALSINDVSSVDQAEAPFLSHYPPPPKPYVSIAAALARGLSIIRRWQGVPDARLLLPGRRRLPASVRSEER